MEESFEAMEIGDGYCWILCSDLEDDQEFKYNKTL